MPIRRHLSPDQLIAAGEGTPSEESRTHLAQCERCRREVAQLSQLLHSITTDELELPPAKATAAVIAMLPTPMPQPSLLQRLQAVLRLDSQAGSMAYGLRSGQAQSRHLLFSVGAYEIDLRLRPQGERWWLMGQLLGDNQAGIVRLTDGTATYLSDISIMGEFDFQGIAAGNYTLIVAIEDTELEISTLSLE